MLGDGSNYNEVYQFNDAVCQLLKISQVEWWHSLLTEFINLL